MNCPKCGQEVADDLAVCPNCGAKLPPQIGAPTGAPTVSASTTHIDSRVEVASAAAGAQITGVEIGQVTGPLTVGYTVEEVQKLIDGLRTRFQPKPYTGESPYIGLQAFQESDAGRFFGRERLVAELLERVSAAARPADETASSAARFVMVAGPSGSGKSSLVRAGLMPVLKGALPETPSPLSASRDWLYAVLRPGRAPLEALGREVARLSGSLNAVADIQEKGLSDPTVLSQWLEIALGESPGRRALVFIDQFEEIFTLLSKGDETSRSAFLNLLTHAATAPGGRTIVLLTMRSDFVANCADYPALNDLLNQGFFQVGGMSGSELVSAIVRPALEVGVQVDPALVSQVIADMQGEPGALPLMQFALKDLFESERQGSGVVSLDLAGYLDRGGLQKALERYADDAFSHLSPNEQELARQVFSGLIQPGQGRQDTARAALFSELTPQGAAPGEVEALIRKLADARLLTTEEVDETPGDDRTARLAHERLLESWPWLRRLVDDNREAIILANQVNEDAQAWQKSKRDPSYLYGGARLALAEEGIQAGRISLSGMGADFIKAAVAARDAARRAARRRVTMTVIGLSIAVVVVSILAGLAFKLAGDARASAEQANLSAERASQAEDQALQRAREAEAARVESLSRQLSAQSLVELFEGRLDTAFLLAAQSQLTLDTPQSRSALLTALQAVDPRLEHLLPAHPDTIFALEYSPDGSLLASAGCARRDLSREKCLEGEVRLWNPDNGALLGRVPGITERISLLAFSPDGKTLAAVDDQGQLWLIDPQRLALRGDKLPLPVDPVIQAMFSLDGRSLLLRGQDAKIFRLDDLQSGAIQAEDLPPELAAAESLRISPDGRLALVQLEDGDWIYRVDGWQPQVRLEAQSSLQQRAFSPDGTLLAGVQQPSQDSSQQIKGANQLMVWNTATGSVVAGPFDGFENFDSLAFSPDGKYLVISQNGVIQTLDLASQETLASIRLGNTDRIRDLVFSPDGRTLAGVGRDDAARLWDWSAFPSLGKQVLSLPPQEANALAFSPDRKLIAYGRCAPDSATRGDACTRGQVLLVDAATGQPIGEPLEGHTNLVTQLAFSPDGRLLASAGWDKTIRLWDVASRQPLGEPLIGHENNVTGLVFTPDGKKLVSSSRDGTLRLWDVASGGQIGAPLTGHQAVGDKAYVTALALSPDGRWAASGGIDTRVILWDLSAASPSPQLLGEGAQQVQDLAFSPDGTFLASGDALGRVVLWDLAARQPRFELAGQSDRVSRLAFSPDGRILASGGWDDSIRLWDVASGAQIGGPLTGHSDNIGRLDFDLDGNGLFSFGNDGKLLFWSLDPASWIERACQIASRGLSQAEWAVWVGASQEFTPVCLPPQ